MLAGVPAAQRCGQCDLRGQGQIVYYTVYTSRSIEDERDGVTETNLLPGRMWLLTGGRTDSPQSPAQKPTEHTREQR